LLINRKRVTEIEAGAELGQGLEEAMAEMRAMSARGDAAAVPLARGHVMYAVAASITPFSDIPRRLGAVEQSHGLKDADHCQCRFAG
jgi:hypothetical protein